MYRVKKISINPLLKLGGNINRYISVTAINAYEINRINAVVSYSCSFTAPTSNSWTDNTMGATMDKWIFNVLSLKYERVYD